MSVPSKTLKSRGLTARRSKTSTSNGDTRRRASATKKSSSSSSSSFSTRVYVRATDDDFIRGRGGHIIQHPGNQRLLKIVRRLVQNYRSLKRGQKSALSLQLVQQFQAQGVRFLASAMKTDDEGNRLYYVMDEKRAIQVVEQKFRDAPDEQGIITEDIYNAPSDPAGIASNPMQLNEGEEEENDDDIIMPMDPSPIAEPSVTAPIAEDIRITVFGKKFHLFEADASVEDGVHLEGPFDEELWVDEHMLTLDGIPDNASDSIDCETTPEQDVSMISDDEH